MRPIGEYNLKNWRYISDAVIVFGVQNKALFGIFRTLFTTAIFMAEIFIQQILINLMAKKGKIPSMTYIINLTIRKIEDKMGPDGEFHLKHFRRRTKQYIIRNV